MTNERSLWVRVVTDPAHLLSLARVPLAAIVWWRPQEPWFVVTLLGIAAVTDMLDGWIGRRTHPPASGTANVGAWLDPVCDKVFMLSAAVAIMIAYDLRPFIVVLVLVRDWMTLLLTGLFRVIAGGGTFHEHDFRARKSGKATTGAQGLTLMAAMFAPAYVTALAITTAGIGLVAVLERVVLAWRDHRRRARLADGAQAHSGSGDSGG